VSVGVPILGLLNGMIFGILGVGLVLVHKSSRFINLAQAQIGALPALVLAKLVIDHGWNWWSALGAALTLGAALGLLIERFLVRSVSARSRSPLPLLLLSIGVSQLLLAVTYLPALTPKDPGAVLYPEPFNASVNVGNVVLTGSSLLTLGLVPALVAALAVFLRYSALGRQIRAAANNPDAARLCGVSVKRVAAITWAIAGALAAASAVLAAPSQPGFNVGLLGPYLLMMALGAATVGAFTSIAGTLVGGLVLGQVTQLVAARTSSGTNAVLAAFVVILVVVLIRGRRIAEVFAFTGAAVPERPRLRVPAALRHRFAVRNVQYLVAVGALLVALLLPLVGPLQSESNRFQLTLVVIYALLGVSLTMLIGWGGQVSLGHFAVVGLTALATTKLASHGWSLPALLVVAALIGSVALVVIGLPSLRVPGFTLAGVTLGFAVVAHDWLFQQSWFGSSDGLSSEFAHPALPRGLGEIGDQYSVYLLAVGVVAIAIASGAALRRSLPGRTVVAVRDNERASAAFGIAPASAKLSILAVSGGFAGCAGVLWAAAWRDVTVAQFDPSVSLAVLAIPVVGGLGSLGGSAVAAVLIYVPAFFIGPHVADLFGDFGRDLGFQLFLGGAALVATVRNMPNGIAGKAQAGWQWFLDRWAAKAEGSSAAREYPSAGVSAPAVLAEPTGGVLSRYIERSRRVGETDTALVIEGVVKRFGHMIAVDNPQLVVRRGEIVGLIGPNGAGKTTLMNIVSGVLRADAGSIRLFGSEAADLPPHVPPALGVARSFQDAALFPGLTVRETIQLALGRRCRVGFVSALACTPWARAADRAAALEADLLIDRFGLRSWADSLTSELSTGTRRICDLAAQVAGRPQLLLLDEPTAGVAQRDAEAFGPVIRSVRDELQCAVLIIEHDMPLLMSVCDRVYAMETGRVIAEGTPGEIRANHLVIASYLGSDDIAIARSGPQQGETVHAV
jgi:ABC-type branched-subunit amino acid transport system ATPase component/ABC-type branched-subunit amino acid transport system permease subunit